MGKQTRDSLTTVQTNKGSVTFPRLYILGFYLRDETAMLVEKTMAKCRSSFAK